MTIILVFNIASISAIFAQETTQDSTFPACIDYNLSQDECDRVIKWIADCTKTPEECEKSGYELAELIVEFKVGERRWEQLNESEKERIMEETWELSMNVEYTPPDPEYGEIIDRLEREYGRSFTNLLFQQMENKSRHGESYDALQFASDFEEKFKQGELVIQEVETMFLPDPALCPERGPSGATTDRIFNNQLGQEAYVNTMDDIAFSVDDIEYEGMGTWVEFKTPRTEFPDNSGNPQKNINFVTKGHEYPPERVLFIKEYIRNKGVPDTEIDSIHIKYFMNSKAGVLKHFMKTPDNPLDDVYIDLRDIGGSYVELWSEVTYFPNDASRDPIPWGYPYELYGGLELIRLNNYVIARTGDPKHTPYPECNHRVFGGSSQIELPSLIKLYSNPLHQQLIIETKPNPPYITNVYHEMTPTSPADIYFYADITDPSGIFMAYTLYTTDSTTWTGTLMQAESLFSPTYVSDLVTVQPTWTGIDYTVCATDGNGNWGCEENAQCSVTQALEKELERLFPSGNSSGVGAQGYNNGSAEIVIKLDNGVSTQASCNTGIHKIVIGCTDTDPPPKPALNPLTSPDYDGEYTVSWNAVNDTGCAGLQKYELEETTGSGLKTTHNTSQAGYLITGKGVGTYTYRVRAWDGAGNDGLWSDAASVSVEIQPGQPPSVVIDDLYLASVSTTGTFNIRVLVTDPDGLSDIPRDGVVAEIPDGSGNKITLEYHSSLGRAYGRDLPAPSTPGTYIIKVIVTDKGGLSANVADCLYVAEMSNYSTWSDVEMIKEV